MNTEVVGVVETLPDVKQLLVDSHTVSRLAAATPDLTPTLSGRRRYIETVEEVDYESVLQERRS